MRIHELNERALTPGERRTIELKIDAYQKKLEEIESYRNKIYTLQDWDKIDPNLEQKINDLQNYYQSLIDKLEAELAQGNSQDLLSKLIAGIKKNCSQILSDYYATNKFLYRGAEEKSGAFYGRPFDTRESKDSNPEYSQVFNELLKQAGVEARRDNSIFCSGDKSQASGYGKAVYMLFPRNGFKFTWSKNTRDLVLNNERIHKCFDRSKMIELYRKLNEDQKKFDYLLYHLDSFYYRDEEYVGVSSGFFNPYNWKKVLSMLTTMMNEGMLDESFAKYANWRFYLSSDAMMKNYEISTENMEDAILSNHEVYFRAEYYAIRSDQEPKVRQLLGMRESYWD